MKIFISYRRVDSEYVTGGIYERLKKAFPNGGVFKDVFSIRKGQDFRPALLKAIKECDVLLVVIGDKWLTTVDSAGERRIDNPQDSVHIEVREALAGDIVVIPVLVDGVKMPSIDEMPDPLKELSYRNAQSVRPDPDFARDMDRLVEALAGYSDPEPTGNRFLNRRTLMAVAATGVAAVAVPFAIFRRKPVEINVGLKQWIGYTPLAVASELELFPDDIHVVFRDVETAREVPGLLSDGVLQVGFVTVADHVVSVFMDYKSRLNDPKRPVAFLKVDTSRGADGIVARKEISSVAELADKPFLIQKNDVSEFMLKRFCKATNLNYDEISEKAVDESAKEALVRFRQELGFVAVGTYEPNISRMLTSSETDYFVPGAHTILDSGHESVDGLIIDIAIASAGFLKENPAAIKSLLVGWFRAVSLLNNPDHKQFGSALKVAQLFNASEPPSEKWSVENWRRQRALSADEYRSKQNGLSGAGANPPWPDLNENNLFFRSIGMSDGDSQFRKTFREWMAFLKRDGLDPSNFDGSNLVPKLVEQDIQTE